MSYTYAFRPLFSSVSRASRSSYEPGIEDNSRCAILNDAILETNTIRWREGRPALSLSLLCVDDDGDDDGGSGGGGGDSGGQAV